MKPTTHRLLKFFNLNSRLIDYAARQILDYEQRATERAKLRRQFARHLQTQRQIKT